MGSAMAQDEYSTAVLRRHEVWRAMVDRRLQERVEAYIG